jgi:hypothetical protein
VIDLTIPASPREIGFIDTPGYAVGVTVLGSLALVSDGFEGVRLIDISVPSRPREVGFLDTPGFAFNVDIYQGQALVATGLTGLRVVDISEAAINQAH